MKVRHIFPLLIVLLATGAIAALWITNNTIRALGSFSVVLLASALLLFWFAFFSKFRGRVRILGTLLALSGVGVFFGLFKYEGTGSGNGLPTFSPRWKAARVLPPIAPVKPSATSGAASAKPIDSGTVFADSVDFLGPARDGVVPGVSLGADWKTNPPKELWRIGVGKGWSGFAVADSKAITMEERDGREMVVCYDAASGSPLWAHSEESGWSDPMGGDGPRGTPVVREGKVYALGARGRLHCLDLATGAPNWSIDTLGTAEPLVYGQSSAPLLIDGLVVVPGGVKDSAAIRAFSAKDGSKKWEAGTPKASYSSPAVMELNGTRQIVAVNNTTVSGHEISNGELIWEHPWPGGFPNACQPIKVADNQVLVTAAYDQDSMLIELSADGTTKEIWKKNRMKTKFSSAVVHDGYAYGASDGFFGCIDVKTGDRKWKGGRYGFSQHLLVGDKLLIQAEKGPLVLVQATPEERVELGRVEVFDSKTWNVPTLAGRHAFLRNDREAVCLELPVEGNE